MNFDATKGGWISQSSWVEDCRPFLFHPVAFRKDFTLTGKPKKAELLVTGADKFALWLNGKLVGYGPGRSYKARKLYDEYDIKPFLKKGVNHFAVILLPSSGLNIIGTYNRMGFLLQAKIKTANGKTVEIFTDKSWKSRIAEWITADYRLVSLPVGQQLHSNAALEPLNWRMSTPDEKWKNANLLGPIDMPPWLKLEKRPVPVPLENKFIPDLVWQGRGSRKIISLEENFARRFNAEKLTGKNITPVPAEKTFTNKKDNVFCFDFGKTRFIRPKIIITKVSGSVRVELYYDIQLEGTPKASLGFNSEIEGNCDTCLVDKKGYTWELLFPRGLRFITVKITGFGKVKFKPDCKAVDYAYPEAASFETPEFFWQKVWNMAGENLRSSTTDVSVDCCSRENLLWVQDACVSQKAAFNTFGETKMWRHCLDLIAQGVDADGRPSAVVPSDIPSSLFCQQMHWVMSIFEYYLVTGDKTLLQSVDPAVYRYMKHCAEFITKDGLFVPPGHSWHWLDWAEVDKRPYSLPINGLLVLASDAAVNISKVTGNRELSRSAKITALRLRKAIPAFYDKKEKAFRSHIKPKSKLLLATERPSSATGEVAKSLTHNIHSNVLAARANCGSKEMQKAALKRGAKYLSDAPGPANYISFPFMEVLLAPLVEAGYVYETVNILKALCQPFIDINAPTFGERGWGKAGIYGTAHGWSGTLNTVIVERLIGLRPLKPGWKEFLFKPATGWNVDFKYSVITPYGIIVVKAEGGKRSITFPKGTVLKYGNKTFKGSGKNVILNNL